MPHSPPGAPSCRRFGRSSGSCSNWPTPCNPARSASAPPAPWSAPARRSPSTPAPTSATRPPARGIRGFPSVRATSTSRGWPARTPHGGVCGSEASSSSWGTPSPPRPSAASSGGADPAGAAAGGLGLAGLPAYARYRPAGVRLLRSRDPTPAGPVRALLRGAQHPAGVPLGLHGAPGGRVGHPAGPQPLVGSGRGGKSAHHPVARPRRQVPTLVRRRAHHAPGPGRADAMPVAPRERRCGALGGLWGAKTPSVSGGVVVGRYYLARAIAPDGEPCLSLSDARPPAARARGPKDRLPPTRWSRGGYSEAYTTRTSAPPESAEVLPSHRGGRRAPPRLRPGHSRGGRRPAAGRRRAPRPAARRPRAGPLWARSGRRPR